MKKKLFKKVGKYEVKDVTSKAISELLDEGLVKKGSDELIFAKPNKNSYDGKWINQLTLSLNFGTLLIIKNKIYAKYIRKRTRKKRCKPFKINRGMQRFWNKIQSFQNINQSSKPYYQTQHK